jgi:hypothetical protein
MFGFAALAVPAMWFYLREAPTREDEARVRREALLESAYKAIADLKPSPGGTLYMTGRLERAIETLVANGERVELVADQIDLADVHFRCGDFVLIAKEIKLDGAAITRSRVYLEGDDIKAAMNIADSRVTVNPHSGTPNPDHLIYLSGVFRDSALELFGPSTFDLAAHNTRVETIPGRFGIEGRPGPLVIATEDLDWSGETVQDVTMYVYEDGEGNVHQYWAGMGFADIWTEALMRRYPQLEEVVGQRIDARFDALVREDPNSIDRLLRFGTHAPWGSADPVAVFNTYKWTKEEVVATAEFDKLCPDQICPQATLPPPPEAGNCPIPNKYAANRPARESFELEWYMRPIVAGSVFDVSSSHVPKSEPPATADLTAK